MKKEVRKHHTYDITYGTVDVAIEVKQFNTYVNREISFKLKPDKDNPIFEGFILDQKIQIPVSKENIGEFELPEGVSPDTRNRIRDGINNFLDVMYA